MVSANAMDEQASGHIRDNTGKYIGKKIDRCLDDGNFLHLLKAIFPVSKGLKYCG